MNKSRAFEAEGLTFNLDNTYFMQDAAWERVRWLQSRRRKWITRVKYIPEMIRWGVWKASIRGEDGHCK